MSRRNKVFRQIIYTFIKGNISLQLRKDFVIKCMYFLILDRNFNSVNLL